MKNILENGTGEPVREIAELATESPPPASLEHDVLRRLRAEGLLARSSRRSSGLLAAALLAGLAIGLVGGFLLGGRSDDQEARDESPARATRFAFFLWEGESYRPASPGGVDARVERYSRWAADLRGRGRAASGAKLADEARILLPETAPPAPPPSPGALSPQPLGRLAGYFVIEAANVEEARSIAATCPHLEYGGAIELRRIEG